MRHGRTLGSVRRRDEAALGLVFRPRARPPPRSEAWPQPDAGALAAGAFKDTVLYGRKLFNETYSVIGPEVARSAPCATPATISPARAAISTAARSVSRLPMIGVYGAFPTYMARENEVRTIEERINGCMERSMNGRELPLGGKEMKAMLAYIQFLSTGVPVGKPTRWARFAAARRCSTRAADPKRGAEVYQKNCAVCHQADGQGTRNGVAGRREGLSLSRRSGDRTASTTAPACTA